MTPAAAGEGATQRGTQGGAPRRRTAARLAAVQALYEMELTDATADQGIADVLNAHGGAALGGGDKIPAPDAAHLQAVVRGVADSRPDLDQAISAALAADLALDRLESLLRAILRAGTYELMGCREIPYRVIITEYMDVAHSFFAGREATIVNAVLDRLAAQLRPSEYARVAETNGRPGKEPG